MKHLLLIVLALTPVAVVRAAAPVNEQPKEAAKLPAIERTVDLGFGFRRVTMAEAVKGGFESIGHFAYLFYQDQKLCQLNGACMVSPSGKMVIYEDANSGGNIFLFHAADGKKTQLTPKFVALVNKFVWSESEGFVEVQFDASHPAQRFPLTELSPATSPVKPVP
jgi:hypothetical protein